MKLTDLANRRPGQLSGGERQRTAIARALVVEPQWLLLDEPLAHLDGSTRDELFELLRTTLAATDAGVIIASHQATEMLRLADELVVLEQGRVLQAGSCEDVYRHPVSLAAARAVAPAWLLEGIARSGTLHVAESALLTGLDPSLSGQQSLILRPSEVRFEVDPDGPAVVVSCDFAADTYHVHLMVRGQRIVAASDTSLEPSTTGHLRLTQRR